MLRQHEWAAASYEAQQNAAWCDQDVIRGRADQALPLERDTRARTVLGTGICTSKKLRL